VLPPINTSLVVLTTLIASYKVLSCTADITKSPLLPNPNAAPKATLPSFNVIKLPAPFVVFILTDELKVAAPDMAEQ
jgi:hypothetical protein